MRKEGGEKEGEGTGWEEVKEGNTGTQQRLNSPPGSSSLLEMTKCGFACFLSGLRQECPQARQLAPS